jgi:NAD(P)H dehydrogenase (quinone)
MNVLLVHAHPEPRSFSSALASTARDALASAGHQVVVSDLYAMAFNPVSGRNNFLTTSNPGYYKQQQEEIHATAHYGFVPEIEAEIRKLEQADLLVFSFPLWWFGMPAILKGWIDRTFAMGRVYGGGRFYENGLGARREARALVLMTTGGGAEAVSGRGVNPSLRTILAPIQHGVLWFNGFGPLEPFVVWHPARLADQARAAYLDRLRERLAGVFEEQPIHLPPLADFPHFGADTKRRFLVVATPARDGAAVGEASALELDSALAPLVRNGFLLDCAVTPPGVELWRAFLTIRAESRDEAEAGLSILKQSAELTFDIHEIA